MQRSSLALIQIFFSDDVLTVDHTVTIKFGLISDFDGNNVSKLRIIQQVLLQKQ